MNRLMAAAQQSVHCCSTKSLVDEVLAPIDCEIVAI